MMSILFLLSAKDPVSLRAYKLSALTSSVRYGLGIVSEEYVEGQVIDIEVELTAYHQVLLPI